MNQITLDRIFGLLMTISQIVAIIFYGLYFKHVLPSSDPAVRLSVVSTMGLYPYF